MIAALFVDGGREYLRVGFPSRDAFRFIDRDGNVLPK